MRTYTQLTREQRYQIKALLKAQHTQTEMAEILGVHKSTISRELRRNRGLRGYRPKQADNLATQRRQRLNRARIPTHHWDRVATLLCEHWSPEPISGWLAQEKGIVISHEWIYRYSYQNKRDGGDLYKHLRCQKPRRKRYGSNDRRGQIKHRISIEQRPKVVDSRSRTGDWEADTVIGRTGGAVLVTLAKRKTRCSILALAKDKSAKAVKEALIDALQPYAAQVHTITYDNGKEFAHHGEIASALDAQGFFAHPYHSWERGLNENRKGLIRQYLPKGTNFDELSHEDIWHIMDKLNNRPRKCLDYKTPNQVFFGINPPVALAS